MQVKIEAMVQAETAAVRAEAEQRAASELDKANQRETRLEGEVAALKAEAVARKEVADAAAVAATERHAALEEQLRAANERLAKLERHGLVRREL